MPDMYFDVDAAITECPVNLMPLIDDTDFKTRETAIAYNAAGMDLVWNFVTSAGALTQTAVTPTTAGNYDWTHQGDGIYTIEIPASGGASINNDTEGYGWFSGVVTGVLPFRGPVIGFRASAINDSLCDAGTTGLLSPTVAARTLDVSAGGEAGVDWANVGTPGSTVSLSATTVATVTTATTATNVTTVNGLAANVITAAATATDFGTEVAAAVWNSDATSYQTQGTFGQAIGDPVADTNTIYKAVVTDAAGATVGVDVVAIQADTDNIQTRLPTVLVSGTADSGSTTTLVDAARTESTTDHWRGQVLVVTAGTNAGLGRLITGFTPGTDTITVSPAFPAAISTDTYEIWPASDAILAQLTHTSAVVPTVTTATNVTTVNGLAANVITATSINADAITAAKVAADVHQETIELAFTYNATADYATATAGSLVKEIADNAGGSALTASAIADAVWDEALAGHAAAGSAGEALSAAGTAGDPWTTALPGAYGAGTAGYIIGTDIPAILVDTGTTLQAELDGIQADTEDIQTRLPAALVGGLMSCDVTAISTDTTAANNLEAMLDGTGGVNLNLQQLIITAGDALPNIVLAGTGSADGISFTRTGAGNPFDAEFAAQIQSECNDAIVAYDPATGTEAAAIKSDTAAILLDTGTDGVVVAAGSKTGFSLTATTGLGNQTANITGNLSGSVGSVTAGVSVANGGIATTSFAAGAIDAAAIATDAGAEIADGILLRKLDRTGTGSDVAQERTVVNALRAIRNKVSVAAGTATITKEDDTTTAWTTAIGTTAGDPISSSDPT